jgi:hypothetical protein
VLPALQVLEFDPAGNLIQGWGGPGYVPNWPGEQTINIDRDSNVWISGLGVAKPS